MTALAVTQAPAVAAATTVVPVTVEQLSRRADAVVLATVRSTRASWEGRVIVTDAELDVRVSMKGSLGAGTTLTLRVPGGVVGDVGQVIPGVPRLERGDTIVAFVTRAEDRAPGRYYLTHLTASILPVVAASAPARAATPAGTVLVRPASEGMIVTGAPAADGSRGHSHAATAVRPDALATQMPRAGLSLDRLYALVRASQ